MDEDIIEKAEAWANRRGYRLADRLGFGIHGIVYLVEGNARPSVAELKIHYAQEPYFREKNVYGRLKEMEVTEIRTFRVPQLIAFDDELLALEMTV